MMSAREPGTSMILTFRVLVGLEACVLEACSDLGIVDHGMSLACQKTPYTCCS